MTPYPPTGDEPERPSIESAPRAGEPKFRLPRPGGTRGQVLSDSTWGPVVRKTAFGFVALCGVALLGMHAPVGMPSEVPATAPQVAQDEATGATTQPGALSPCPTIQAASTTVATAEPKPMGLNTATAQDLDKLPGVGPKKAEEILKLRSRLGKFKKVSDLLRVRGVSAKTLQKWKGLIAIDEPKAADGTAPETGSAPALGQVVPLGSANPATERTGAGAPLSR